MSLMSSPITYPPSSNPAEIAQVRKRRENGEENDTTEPPRKKLMGRRLGELQEISNNVVSKSARTGFVLPPRLASGAQPIENSPIPSDTWRDQSPATEPSQGLDGQYSRSTRGRLFPTTVRNLPSRVPYEDLIAQRSETAAPGRPQRGYFGIDIHSLIDEAKANATCAAAETIVVPTILPATAAGLGTKKSGILWTEKYRARKFTDLCGDERTHRDVLRWLKTWDQIVFPGMRRVKPKAKVLGDDAKGEEERQHRKILLLTGPPGLGKTTLAHVCARQAGYEVVEINASDERSKDVVKGKIRDCVGTENVRGVNLKLSSGDSTRRPGRPVCVVVDEVDGVVGGNGASGGEGGFTKALIDLILLDQRNTKPSHGGFVKKGKRGDSFKMLRPIILICNDVYHASLRPLRASNLAEIVHVRKPPMDKVIERVKHVFDRESVPSDVDGVRRLCEHTWGISGRKEARSAANTGDGDIRSILVASEWAASKLRSSTIGETTRLTKQWVEQQIISGGAGGPGRGARRGGVKEVAERVFLEGAGFPKAKAASKTKSAYLLPGALPVAATDSAKGEGIRLLREVIETAGEADRVMTDVFAAYPTHSFSDDTFLSKPNAAYDWLHFHDALSTRVFSGQEWELNPYLSSPVLGFHYLFGSSARKAAETRADTTVGGQEAEELPFSGPRADYAAYEAGKESRAVLQALQTSLSVPLLRSFRAVEDIAVDLLPQLIRMLTPDVKPVVVGGSATSVASVRRENEKNMVKRSVQAMNAVGVTFEKCRVEDSRWGNGFVYRMEPALDTIATFTTAASANASSTATRFAVRQLLDQEHQKYQLQMAAEARQARFRGGQDGNDMATGGIITERAGLPSREDSVVVGDVPVKAAVARKDFFGRPLTESFVRDDGSTDEGTRRGTGDEMTGVRIWVTFNEGFSNAVRKPLTLRELMDGL